LPRNAVVLSALLLAACASRGRVEVEQRAFDDAAYALPADETARRARFTREAFTGPDGTRLVCRVLAPKAPAGGRLPLVVVLHGSGAIGDDNERQLGPFAAAWAAPALAAEFPAVVLVPQASTRTADYWTDADGLLASRAGASLPALVALIEATSHRADVDPSRVYVVGFSMGASAALDSVATRPDLFAAAVAFSGIAPPRASAEAAAGVPQLLVHGTADEENPVGPDRAWAEAVAAAGGRVRLVEYQGMDHRVPPEMMEARDWRAWLFAQKRK
jgi:predicted esterase